MSDRTPAQLADERDAIADAAREIAAAESFELAFRRLIRRRLRGEISAEQFAAGNLSLHLTYGRAGYGVEDYERDLAEHRERIERRERRAKLDAALRGEGGKP